MKKKTQRKHLPESTWLEIRTAFASGVPLRQLARSMKIAPGTVLGRAKRERWTQQIKSAKALVPATASPTTPTILEAVAESLQARGERHVGRMASLTEKMVGTFERLPEEEQLRLVAELERLDKVARKAFGIADPSDGTPFVAVSVLNQW